MPSAGDARRLLITGASGFLGEHLCRRARNGWTVYGLRHRHRVAVDDVTAINFDLTGYADQLEPLFREIRPQAVIHAAAQSSPDDCERHMEASWQLNVAVSEALARTCARLSIPLVFISTDMVFDGNRAPYAEIDAACPISEYGRQKAAAERRVRRHYQGALICRLPLLIGLSGGHGRTFSMTILDALHHGEPIDLFVDEFRTPVDGGCAAAGILMLLGRVRGLVHLGGRTRISRYQMGCRMADHMGCDHALLRPVPLDQVRSVSPRPPDVSLDSRRAYALGYAPRALDTSLRRMVQAVCGMRR